MPLATNVNLWNPIATVTPIHYIIPKSQYPDIFIVHNVGTWNNLLKPCLAARSFRDELCPEAVDRVALPVMGLRALKEHATIMLKMR